MTDHTGPNTGPGGCHDGLLSRRYQRLLNTGVVAAAPIPAVLATAPRMSAASRRVRPDGRDSLADTVAMFLTLPPSSTDPGPTQPDPSRIRSGAGEPGGSCQRRASRDRSASRATRTFVVQ